MNKNQITLICCLICCFLYSMGSYAQHASFLAPVKQGGKWGYIDPSGSWVVKPSYDFANEFSDNLAAVCINHKWGYIDRQGNMVINTSYEDAHSFTGGFARVRKSGLWGYINTEGKYLVEPSFDSANNFSEGMALVSRSKQYGFLNNMGNLVIAPQYTEAFDFAEGLALVNDRETLAYVNKHGKKISLANCEQAAAYFSEGLAPATHNDLMGYVDKNGQWAINAQYKSAQVFSESLAAVALSPNGRYGFINLRGNLVIPALYEAASYFSAGVAAVSYNGQYGYIDTKGSWIVPPRFDNAEPFKNGIAKVQIDEKYNFINAKGELLGKQAYDWAFDFSESLAAVQIGGKFGFIDVDGNYAIPPTFERCGSFKQVTALDYSHRPVISLLSPSNNSVQTSSASFPLSFHIQSAEPLIDYTIIINERIYEDLSNKGGQNSPHDNFERVLQLSEGKNVISVKAVNKNGNTLTQLLTVDYKPEIAEARKPNLYVLSVGVANFMDSNYNINYADNDAQDIAQIFKEQQNVSPKSKLFEFINVETLTNEDATRENIQRALLNIKKIVRKNDLVLLFISTHGEVDSRNDFYLRTYNTDSDLDMLSVNGLPNKWLAAQVEEFDCTVIQLLDACHSAQAGEDLDKEVVLKSNSMSQADLATRDLQNALSSGKATYFYASSRKQQLSQERHEWQNGAFTEAIIDCFNQKVYTDSSGFPIIADTNGDGFIRTTEFENYLSSVVKLITNGQQSPKSYLHNAEPIDIFVLPAR